MYLEPQPRVWPEIWAQFIVTTCTPHCCPLTLPQGPKGEPGQDGEMVSIQGIPEAWAGRTVVPRPGSPFPTHADSRVTCPCVCARLCMYMSACVCTPVHLPLHPPWGNGQARHQLEGIPVAPHSCVEAVVHVPPPEP